MEEQLISFETAKLAREKGYNISSNTYYSLNPKAWKGVGPYNLTSANSGITINNNHLLLAPTQSLLQKWLRDKYKLHIHVADLGLHLWSFMVTELSIDGTQGKCGDLGKKNYKTYEEALEVGLQETLKLI